jgi:nucleotide-binding universal stress UspA family protein
METLIRNIILGTDFSQASQNALRYAVWMTQTLKAELKLLHVFEPNSWMVPSPYYFTPGFEKWLESSLEKVELRGREALNELAKSLNIKAEPIFVQGNTGKEIVRVAAELNTDLLILGTHGYTGWNHLTLGSIAEFVVRHAPCPVLTVKPHLYDEKQVETKAYPHRV